MAIVSQSGGAAPAAQVSVAQQFGITGGTPVPPEPVPPPPKPEELCRELTGLSVRDASISMGRYLLVNWNALFALDPMMKPAIFPLKYCNPGRLKAVWETLLARDPDLPAGGPAGFGVLRWGVLLLKRIAPILDWNIVLAYARHPDPAAAEHTLAKTPGPPGYARGNPGAATANTTN